MLGKRLSSNLKTPKSEFLKAATRWLFLFVFENHQLGGSFYSNLKFKYRIKKFWCRGKRVAGIWQGPLRAGSHVLSLPPMKHGMYVAKLSDANLGQSSQLILVGE